MRQIHYATFIKYFMPGILTGSVLFTLLPKGLSYQILEVTLIIICAMVAVVKSVIMEDGSIGYKEE